MHDSKESIDLEWNDDEPDCPWCGGDGIDMLSECPELWGEDTFCELDRPVICPQCKGSGLRKDCDVM